MLFVKLNFFMRVPIRNAKDQKCKRKIRSDIFLIGTVAFLIVCGLVIIASAGIARSMLVYEEPYYFFTHQLLFGFLPGIVIWSFLQAIDYHQWKRFALPIFILALFLLAIVLIPGVGMSLKGAQRWIEFKGFSFQPTELCKLAIIIYLSAWLSSKHGNFDSFKGFIGFLFILFAVGLLIMLQPDMGTMGIITIIACSIYFLSGARLFYFFALGILGAIFLWILIFIAPYRMERITVFLDPASDTQNKSYQINQALIAIGSGGVTGLGLGHGRQKFHYLPEPVGDSIFAIVGEETGLVGASFLVFLFFMLAWRGFVIASRAPDCFGRLMAVGLTTWFVFQALINMAAISGVIPLTGMPLPFISYGGSALIFAMAGTGILVNISKQMVEKKR